MISSTSEPKAPSVWLSLIAIIDSLAFFLCNNSIAFYSASLCCLSFRFSIISLNIAFLFNRFTPTFDAGHHLTVRKQARINRAGIRIKMMKSIKKVMPTLDTPP